MCTMLAMAGLSAAQAGASIYGQTQAQKQFNATESMRQQQQEVLIEENRRRATYDFLNSVRLEQTQQSQEEAAVAQKSMDVERQATASIATGEASAAERGVAGRSVDQIAQDFDFMANEESGRLQLNQKISNQQHAENIRSFGNDWSNRVASVKPYIPTPAKPIDYFGPVFQAGAQVLSTDMAYSRANPTAPTMTNWLSAPTKKKA
ncbi:MAG TPA: hypothetical protein VN039_12345 [Nitrospira sp.]|nr:hypothetical protein [Nitrospira sp.]